MGGCDFLAIEHKVGIYNRYDVGFYVSSDFFFTNPILMDILTTVSLLLPDYL